MVYGGHAGYAGVRGGVMGLRRGSYENGSFEICRSVGLGGAVGVGQCLCLVVCVNLKLSLTTYGRRPGGFIVNMSRYSRSV